MATFSNADFDSTRYSGYRPYYTEAVFDLIYEFHSRESKNKFEVAIDIGSGTGQVARHLAQKFDAVRATDASAKMLESAVQHPKIQYSVGRAEQLEFEDESADLITIGQAIHWVDTKKFFSEVKRVLRPGGTLAVIGYTFCASPDLPSLHEIVMKLGNGILNDYWEPGRLLVDNYYRDIDFGSAFSHVERHTTTALDKKHFVEKEMTLNTFCTYLKTWSAYHNFMKAHPGVADPVEEAVAIIAQKDGVSDWDKPFMVVFPAVLILASKI
ncbi:uncharacterized protein VTP21DRAFT_7542 [Calcarisporiella thermophila]|uniref:uncharacterized protein n=1 Tax=Calcarisporiella thermophila TaxID=911321 RepID=UPI0037427572